MKLMIESTDEITQLDGVSCRIWHGTTEGGVPCLVLVHRVAVANSQDQSQFEAELVEMLPPDRTTNLDEEDDSR